MAKLQTLFAAALGTLALALPSSLLALGIVALLDEHLPRIALAVASVNWRALTLEASARWPELAGMLIGGLLLLAILVLGDRTVLENRAEA